LLIIQNIVTDGVQQGFFNEEDPEKFSIMFWGTLHGLIHFKKFERTILGNESHKQLYDYSVQKLVHSLK